MSISCIKDANLEETGFNYTMSLIQGKYKMFISVCPDGVSGRCVSMN